MFTNVTHAKGDNVFPSKEKQNEAFGMEDRFERMEEIGRGSFSVVFKVTDKKLDGQSYALKCVVLPQSEALRKPLLDEVQMMNELDHVGIVKMFESFQIMKDLLHVVLELVPGSSLRKLLDARGALDTSVVVPMARQMADALHYLHSTVHIVHRDLKPENLMSAGRVPDNVKDPIEPTELQWKICDFGVAVRGKQHRGGDYSDAMLMKLNCSRCKELLFLPPRKKRGALREIEKVKCPKCGHSFGVEFEFDKALDNIGLAVDVSDDGQTMDMAGISMGGTAGYMAPELVAIDTGLKKGKGALSTEEAQCLCSTALDIFSYGRVLHYALTGIHPNSTYKEERVASAAAFVRRPSFTRSSPKALVRRRTLSAPAQALIAALTAHEPEKRPQANSPAIREWLDMMGSSVDYASGAILNVGTVIAPKSSK